MNPGMRSYTAFPPVLVSTGRARTCNEDKGTIRLVHRTCTILHIYLQASGKWKLQKEAGEV